MDTKSRGSPSAAEILLFFDPLQQSDEVNVSHSRMALDLVLHPANTVTADAVPEEFDLGLEELALALLREELLHPKHVQHLPRVLLMLLLGATGDDEEGRPKRPTGAFVHPSIRNPSGVDGAIPVQSKEIQCAAQQLRAVVKKYPTPTHNARHQRTPDGVARVLASPSQTGCRNRVHVHTRSIPNPCHCRVHTASIPCIPCSNPAPTVMSLLIGIIQ